LRFRAAQALGWRRFTKRDDEGEAEKVISADASVRLMADFINLQHHDFAGLGIRTL
jgi:hypothetical protein